MMPWMMHTHAVSSSVSTAYMYQCNLLLGPSMECGVVFIGWDLLPRTLIQAFYCSAAFTYSMASKITDFFKKG